MWKLTLETSAYSPTETGYDNGHSIDAPLTGPQAQMLGCKDSIYRDMDAVNQIVRLDKDGEDDVVQRLKSQNLREYESGVELVAVSADGDNR